MKLWRLARTVRVAVNPHHQIGKIFIVSATGASGAPALSAGGLAGMVDALKQFDANGQALHAVKSVATGMTHALETKPRKPDVDVLANGK